MTFPLCSRCRSLWETAGKQESLILCSFFVHMRHMIFLINTQWLSLFSLSTGTIQIEGAKYNERMQTKPCLWMLWVVFVSVVLTMRRSSTIIYRFLVPGAACPRPIYKYVIWCDSTTCLLSFQFMHKNYLNLRHVLCSLCSMLYARYVSMIVCIFIWWQIFTLVPKLIIV